MKVRYILLFILIFFIKIDFCFSGIWPFYFKDNGKINVFAPFFQKDDNLTVFRPFFLYKKENNDYNFDLFYPIISFSKNKKRIFPFYSSREKEKDHTNFFPFFWGKTQDNRTYGGFFPIYGKLLNRLGYNEIKFFLWPIWTEKRREKDNDYLLFWPFFGFSKGENYSGFRFWPFFGIKEKKNWFYEKYFLWPLFIFQKRKIGGKVNDYEIKNMFFPFYIHTYSKDYNYNTFIWPFFHYNTRKPDYKYFAFPWPIFSYEREGKYYEFNFFPFYRKVYQKNFKKQSFLWIIYSNEETFLNNKKYTSKKSFLLINRFERNYRKKYVYKNVWPFFEYVKQGNSYIFKLFEPFPFKIFPFYSLYSTFFNIFYIAKTKNKKRINFLWGLFVYEKHKNFSMIKIFQFLKFKWSHEKKNIKISDCNIDTSFAGL